MSGEYAQTEREEWGSQGQGFGEREKAWIFQNVSKEACHGPGISPRGSSENLGHLLPSAYHDCPREGRWSPQKPIPQSELFLPLKRKRKKKQNPHGKQQNMYKAQRPEKGAVLPTSGARAFVARKEGPQVREL